MQSETAIVGYYGLNGLFVQAERSQRHVALQISAKEHQTSRGQRAPRF
jgi:hypothetical protein